MIFGLLKKIISCCVFLAIVWSIGLLWFISEIPSHESTNPTKTDAIVVLTGGSGRLEHGFEIFSAGYAKHLLITGVNWQITDAELIRQFAPLVMQPSLLHNPNLTIDHEAENTIANAEQAGRWLTEHDYKSIRLVTTNVHMPRALSEFSQVNPDVTVIPEPVFSDDFPAASWWIRESSRTLLLSEYHKYIAARLRHWAVSVMHKS